MELLRRLRRKRSKVLVLQLSIFPSDKNNCALRLRWRGCVLSLGAIRQSGDWRSQVKQRQRRKNWRSGADNAENGNGNSTARSGCATISSARRGLRVVTGDRFPR
jgi:hypothetical protein